jgi:hypothetical protein
MLLSERIELLGMLGDYLATASDSDFEPVLAKAWADNKWFTSDHIKMALQAISIQMLDRELLTDWALKYQIPETGLPTHAIGIVMAGNIPLVGFSDWLAVFVSGQRSIVKLSEKDQALLPWLIQKMGAWMPQSSAYTHFLVDAERLAGFDAVIATGSNNTARYFEQYFGKYPHIIRQNRNSVAVLTGQETPEQLVALAKDIYLFFGLGCRNVSRLYVPEGTDMEALALALDQYPHYADHNKYRNNYDYNTTLYILNKMPYYCNNSLILREETPIASRVSTVNFSYYKDLQSIENELLTQLEAIQCVATIAPLSPTLPLVQLGQTQSPTLTDYPDGVDVMAWMKGLKG